MQLTLKETQQPCKNMKIPFDIKYRNKIQSGEAKVETRDGLPVRVVCWDVIMGSDMDGETPVPVYAFINFGSERGEEGEYYPTNGSWCRDLSTPIRQEHHRDLLINVPDPKYSKGDTVVTIADECNGVWKVVGIARDQEDPFRWTYTLKDTLSNLTVIRPEGFERNSLLLEKADTPKVDESLQKFEECLKEFKNGCCPEGYLKEYSRHLLNLAKDVLKSQEK